MKFVISQNTMLNFCFWRISCIHCSIKSITIEFNFIEITKLGQNSPEDQTCKASGKNYLDTRIWPNRKVIYVSRKLSSFRLIIRSFLIERIDVGILYFCYWHQRAMETFMPNEIIIFTSKHLSTQITKKMSTSIISVENERIIKRNVNKFEETWMTSRFGYMRVSK